MRYLWITTIVMVVGGVALVLGGVAGLLDQIALVFGLLLLWSGAVKVIVLRIWRKSLNAAIEESPPAPSSSSRSPLGRLRS